MVIVTLQRNKCIGCNYCVEFAPEFFRMSKKDGKSVLLRSIDRKGFHTIKTPQYDVFESFYRASKACPVNIISVKDI
jgi:ferredoxin